MKRQRAAPPLGFEPVAKRTRRATRPTLLDRLPRELRRALDFFEQAKKYPVEPVALTFPLLSVGLNFDWDDPRMGERMPVEFDFHDEHGGIWIAKAKYSDFWYRWRADMHTDARRYLLADLEHVLPWDEHLEANRARLFHSLNPTSAVAAARSVKNE